ncbi:MAG TPA: S4 domain-containing protein YaaA [Erysipelotrichaceae bacterium]|nr:S4 domain-containing protein YaaA [Erysipelotrichaceae bacterium]
MIKITTEYITLQQFMKLSGIAQTGGEAKILVKETEIFVNGEKENRRGRKLYPGDVIRVSGKMYVISK